MSASGKVRVLLVENNSSDVKFVNELLTALGRNKFLLSSVGTLSEALSLLKKESYHVILLDLNLPDSKGLNTITKMRNEIINTPIIVLTVVSDKEVISLKELKTGVQDFLLKGSIDSNLLGQVINYSIARMTFERAISDRSEVFNAFLNSVKESALLIDVKGNIILANEESAMQFKSKVNEIVGKNIYELISDKLAIIQKSHINKAINSKKTISFEDIHEDKNYENRIYPLIEHDGSVKRLAILKLEVTERKKSEDSLKQRMKELSIIYDTGKIMEKFELTTALRELIELIPKAYSFPELISARITYNNHKFETKNFKKTKWAQSASIMVNGKKAGLVEIYYLKNKIFSAEENKMLREVVAQISNITNRKKSVNTLSSSASRYRGFFEGVRDGVLILDAETGLILDVNPFLIELLGYSHKVFLGKHIWEIGLFKDVAASKTEFAKLLLKKYVKYEDLPLETSAGKRIDVEFVSTAYNVGDKKVIQCNIRDITERLKSEQIKLESEAQKKIDKLREEFLILVTHDLKQPLTPIIGYTEIIKDELKTPESIAYSNKIIAEAFRLQEMIDKVLNLLRIESNKLVLTIKKQNIKELINEAIKIKNAIMDIRHISVITELKDINALFDADRLKDVMLNLLDNAIKFSKEGGKIELKSYAQDNYAYISIKDHGIGIKKEDVPRLFTKFFQTKEGKEAGGTGVGLAICKELITAMKGTISVKSEYGKGTELIIKLPLQTK